MTPQQLGEAIARGAEQPGVEFKAAGPRTDKLLLAKVLRALLAMANRRDGGSVILGVDDSGGKLLPTGVTPADEHTWTADLLADAVAPYASPRVEFHVVSTRLDDATFIIITVSEFSDTPVLCKKHLTLQGQVVLREGACYVRPRHKAESSEVASYVDMRDLLDLAAEKALRRVVRTVRGAGVSLDATTPTDDDFYVKQLGDLA